MLKIKLIKNYYDNDDDIYEKSTVTFDSGVTVLVGCNGSGKTTTIKLILQMLKQQMMKVKQKLL